MKEIALKVGREVVKIICYLSIVGMILMGFGIFAVFFAGQNHGGLFTLDYGYQRVQVSVWIPIVVLIMAMIIFYLLFRIMRALDKLLINFQDEEYICFLKFFFIRFYSQEFNCLLISCLIFLK